MKVLCELTFAHFAGSSCCLCNPCLSGDDPRFCRLADNVSQDICHVDFHSSAKSWSASDAPNEIHAKHEDFLEHALSTNQRTYASERSGEHVRPNIRYIGKARGVVKMAA